jgi:hypothetical protein
MQSFDVISYPRAFRFFIFYIFIVSLFLSVELRLAHGQAQKPDTPYVAELKKQLGGGSGGLSSFDITFIQNTAKAFLADPDKQKDFKTYLGSGAAAFEKKYGAGMLDYVNSIRRKDQLETLTKNQIERISDPVKATQLADETSLGGATSPVFIENHTTMINPKSVIDPLIPGLYPIARNGFNTYQCQENGWPTKYWCSGCEATLYDGGPCIAWGITPADTTRLFTEKLTVARGNDSAPYTLSLLRNLANNLQSAISAVPVASSLKVMLNTVDFRQYCMNAMLMNNELSVASGITTGKSADVDANDIGQSLLACITKPNLSANGMPKPSGINLLGLTSKQDGDYFKAALDGKITMAQAERLERALTTAAIGKMPGAINYNFGLTPAVASRLLAKTFQDNKATYPNFRFIVTIGLQVGFEIVQDPLIPFNILPPTREPSTPTAAEFLNTKSPNAQFADNQLQDSRVRLASAGTSMTDFGTLPLENENNYFAVPSQGANAKQNFSFAKDIFDGNLNMFIRGLPYDLALARSPTIIGFNKVLAANFIPFLEQKKNPDLCTNPALALAFQNSNTFNNPVNAKLIRYIQQLDRALMLLKFNGGTSREAAAVISDIKKTFTTASNLTSGNIGQVQSKACTAITQTAINTELNLAKSNAEMGAIAKAVVKDAQDITLFKEKTPLLTRPRANFKYRFPYSATINPRIYNQKYSESSFNDKVQPSKAHLEALAPYAGGMQFKIEEDCRAPDITDDASGDEKLSVVGAGPNQLNRWTAFASCPEYEPTNPNSIEGFLLRNVVFGIIPFPGPHLGVERFNIREY